jgi:hypothetical protein
MFLDRQEYQHGNQHIDKQVKRKKKNCRLALVRMLLSMSVNDHVSTMAFVFCSRTNFPRANETSLFRLRLDFMPLPWLVIRIDNVCQRYCQLNSMIREIPRTNMTTYRWS